MKMINYYTTVRKMSTIKRQLDQCWNKCKELLMKSIVLS